ncbi:hypothetical protein Pcinc_024095 [Petrolisthes cinctipes]|uniref:Uncharacterized protein n=1 Tax=Petrolisthes cinctipes TaxID=88211 RepID=A0AAE1KEW6_PETCI|nr:hypothetical protein Pcinc_024095 [Petrolisthes cinctipes]
MKRGRREGDTRRSEVKDNEWRGRGGGQGREKQGQSQGEGRARRRVKGQMEGERDRGWELEMVLVTRWKGGKVTRRWKEGRESSWLKRRGLEEAKRAWGRRGWERTGLEKGKKV